MKNDKLKPSELVFGTILACLGAIVLCGIIWTVWSLMLFGLMSFIFPITLGQSFGIVGLLSLVKTILSHGNS